VFFPLLRVRPNAGTILTSLIEGDVVARVGTDIGGAVVVRVGGPNLDAPPIDNINAAHARGYAASRFDEYTRTTADILIGDVYEHLGQHVRVEYDGGDIVVARNVPGGRGEPFEYGSECVRADALASHPTLLGCGTFYPSQFSTVDPIRMDVDWLRQQENNDNPSDTETKEEQPMRIGDARVGQRVRYTNSRGSRYNQQAEIVEIYPLAAGVRVRWNNDGARGAYSVGSFVLVAGDPVPESDSTSVEVQAHELQVGDRVWVVEPGRGMSYIGTVQRAPSAPGLSADFHYGEIVRNDGVRGGGRGGSWNFTHDSIVSVTLIERPGPAATPEPTVDLDGYPMAVDAFRAADLEGPGAIIEFTATANKTGTRLAIGCKRAEVDRVLDSSEVVGFTKMPEADGEGRAQWEITFRVPVTEGDPTCGVADCIECSRSSVSPLGVRAAFSEINGYARDMKIINPGVGAAPSKRVAFDFSVDLSIEDAEAVATALGDLPSGEDDRLYNLFTLLGEKIAEAKA
jgi:hypothetical protein